MQARLNAFEWPNRSVDRHIIDNKENEYGLSVSYTILLREANKNESGSADSKSNKSEKPCAISATCIIQSHCVVEDPLESAEATHE